MPSVWLWLLWILLTRQYRQCHRLMTHRTHRNRWTDDDFCASCQLFATRIALAPLIYMEQNDDYNHFVHGLMDAAKVSSTLEWKLYFRVDWMEREMASVSMRESGIKSVVYKWLIVCKSNDSDRPSVHEFFTISSYYRIVANVNGKRWLLRIDFIVYYCCSCATNNRLNNTFESGKKKDSIYRNMRNCEWAILAVKNMLPKNEQHFPSREARGRGRSVRTRNIIAQRVIWE